MANNLNTNPMLIDTFSADFDISLEPILIKKIRLFSAADGDVLSLNDKNGNKVIRLVQSGNDDVVEDSYGEKGFQFDGLKCVVADCTGLGANDLIWIYVI